MKIPSNTEHNWHLLDAKGKVLGKVAVEASVLLMGKNKVNHNNYLDNGDLVVVINAKDVVLTGKKLTDKKYISHSGYPGGLKEISAGKLLITNPERLIHGAIYGMLPKNKLRDIFIKRLKIYPSNEHPHKLNIKG